MSKHKQLRLGAIFSACLLVVIMIGAYTIGTMSQDEALAAQVGTPTPDPHAGHHAAQDATPTTDPHAGHAAADAQATPTADHDAHAGTADRAQHHHRQPRRN